MPLDEATRRFSFLLQRDLRRLTENEEAHDARGEELKYDSVSRLAVYESRGGDVAGRLYGEMLASYSTDDRILRWAWAGRTTSASFTHGDAVFREGQSRGIPQLAMSVVGDLDPDEAISLARLGALVARAEALHVREVMRSIQYIGLFDRPRPRDPDRASTRQADEVAEGRYSVPPPPVGLRDDKSRTTTPPPPARAYRSLPPIQEIFEPRTSSRPPPPGARTKLREPGREVFLPVATAALAALARGSAGYRQGLFVLRVDGPPDAGVARRSRSDVDEPWGPEKRRLLVQLVVLDAQGILRALDPPAALIDAAAQMIDADRRSGNAVWHRLSARITPKPDGGATLNVDVL